MGFFRKSQKKKTSFDEKISSPILEDEKVRKAPRLESPSDRVLYIKEHCELYQDSNQQIEEAKAEYQAVTSYLTDMQKIDLIPLEQRGVMEDAARNIYNLTKERYKQHNKSMNISDKHYRLLEHYELQIPKELPSMRDAEKFKAVIEQDIEHLDKEREKLDEEQEDILSKQAFLKGIAVVASLVVIGLFMMFVIISYNSEADFTLPFLLTVLMGMIIAVVIYLEARKNISGNSYLYLKQNRQILLMNKVKIKAVNNRNYLEYTYNKYMVESYEELKAHWEEFVKLKDESRRYQKSTDLLEYYNKLLIQELKKFMINDAEIWIFQSNAILDRKEMADVRHRLNIRRQKLRERIDLNTLQKEKAEKAIAKAIREYPDCEADTEAMLRQYKINL